MRDLLTTTIGFFFEFLSILVLIRVVLSWVQFDPRNRWILILFQLTDPIIEPIKRMLAKYNVSFGTLDISPLVALIALELVQRFLITIIYFMMPR